MKIKDIKNKEVRDLAILIYREDRPNNTYSSTEIGETELEAAFVWKDTTKGHDYWYRIDQGSCEIEQRNYMSTYDFVDENKLHDKAVELFGKDWEAEDDLEQIEALLKHLGLNHYEVRFIETRSDYDMEVKFSEDKKRIEELETELRELKASIQNLIK